MSTERDVAYLLRSWMRSEPDGAVDHVVDAILAEVDATPQRRSTWWPARRPTMSTIVRLGVAAAVLAIAVVLGYTLTQNVGNEQPIPNPSGQPTAPDTSPVAGDISELLGIFIGATRDVPGIEVVDRLVLDTTSRVFRVHIGADQTALLSAMSVVESGVLRLETVDDTTECADGDVGTYPYTLSPGGTALAIASGDDDCAPRAATVIGEWRRSACQDQGNWCLGALEAGAQTSLFFDPYLAEFGPQVARHGAMMYEVPDGWANADDRTHFYTLMRASAYEEGGINCLDCPDSIFLGANPRAALMDCSEEAADEAIGASAEALAGWVRAHPGLTVSEGPAITVDGRQTFVLDIMASEEYEDACVDPELDRSLVPLFTHPGYSFGIGTGDRHRLMLVEIEADTAMLIGIDTLDPADIDAFAAEVQPIVDSIRLMAP